MVCGNGIEVQRLTRCTNFHLVDFHILITSFLAGAGQIGERIWAFWTENWPKIWKVFRKLFPFQNRFWWNFLKPVQIHKADNLFKILWTPQTFQAFLWCFLAFWQKIFHENSVSRRHFSHSWAFQIMIERWSLRKHRSEGRKSKKIMQKVWFGAFNSIKFRFVLVETFQWKNILQWNSLVFEVFLFMYGKIFKSILWANCLQLESKLEEERKWGHWQWFSFVCFAHGLEAGLRSLSRSWSSWSRSQTMIWSVSQSWSLSLEKEPKLELLMCPEEESKLELLMSLEEEPKLELLMSLEEELKQRALKAAKPLLRVSKRKFRPKCYLSKFADVFHGIEDFLKDWVGISWRD